METEGFEQVFPYIGNICKRYTWPVKTWSVVKDVDQSENGNFVNLCELCFVQMPAVAYFV